ncbi:MAG: hypothetical protein RLZZ09_1672 [Pseudomonadota bacterium]|jgi:type I restriction enzyme R subunit
MFLRNVSSLGYYEQMVGRGVRVIDHDSLKLISGERTPPKTRFVIVDAVGVCDRDKTSTRPLDRQPGVKFEKVLRLAGQGVVHADVVSALAAHLARLSLEVSDEEAEMIHQEAGQPLQTLTATLLDSVNPDHTDQRARVMFEIADDQEPSEEQLDAAEQAAMSEALRPFSNPELRKLLLDIKSRTEQVIDEVTPDTLLGQGFSEVAQQRARSVMAELRAFCEEHRNEIEALRLIYQQPHRSGLSYRQVKELARQLSRAPFHVNPDAPADAVRVLWENQRLAEPDRTQGEARGLVDLIALVRHALHPEEPVIPVQAEIEARYREWLEEQHARGVAFTPEQRQWLDMIKNHIATSLAIAREDFQDPPFFLQGGLGKVYQLFGEKLDTVLSEMNERLAA